MPYKDKGTAISGIQNDAFADNGTIVLFEDGAEIMVFTGEHKVRFFLISGKPIGGPVAWHGPIVMSARKELRIAFEEHKQGLSSNTKDEFSQTLTSRSPSNIQITSGFHYIAQYNHILIV